MIYSLFVTELICIILTTFKIKNEKNKIILYLLTTVLFGTLTYSLLHVFVSPIVAGLCLSLLVIVISVIFINIGKKVSLFYLLVLLVIESVLLFCGFVFDEYQYIFGYLMTLVFVLSENNQSYLRKNYEDSCIEYQKKIMNKQIEEVQNIYMTMRGWRHDYHNHLQSIKAHIKLEQYEELIKYLNDLEVDLKDVSNLVETGNVELDAILNAKISLALNHQIKVEYKAVVPEKLTVKNIDLCVLLGNLIDNAVEACDLMSEKKFIRLYIGVFKSQLYISVTNSTKELVRKLDEEYITTKRGNHGHGLKRINNIVNKYDGFINRKNEPGVFVTEIMLPL